MRPIINNNKCINCGACANLVPDVFMINSENQMEVTADIAYEKFADEILEAQKACPVEAIDIID